MNESTCEVRLNVGSNGEAATLFGKNDENLRFIQSLATAKIIARGNQVSIIGNQKDVARIENLFHELMALNRTGETITRHTIHYTMDQIEAGQADIARWIGESLCITQRGKHIRVKTVGQSRYVEAMRNQDLVFAVGPAGTGKTYLAVVMAVINLKDKRVGRIVLVRPAVEAGEKLGFLPGDLQEKVNPYLRPLYDGLYDILGIEMAQKYMERGVIEVAPLAYMRGRTLDDAFIILDEAQNTTPEQMKMLLTRIGQGSKAVVTGDVTQVDLPKGSMSGLVQAQEVLARVEGVSFCYLSEKDVVRHPLVQRVIRAYEQHGQVKESEFFNEKEKEIFP